MSLVMTSRKRERRSKRHQLSAKGGRVTRCGWSERRYTQGQDGDH
ncbi:uncharacterized protein CTRU02_213863 [Colletotrichum truncatum]|uniref:Uncharacterized protein n=1 Tax=Colletotrichum truncatum TaxID=5467 RepID=A0ACC3YGV3_COLTU